MKFSSPRKHLRYYFVRPASDRRLEQRFESREDVVVRFTEEGRIRPAVASDIGRMGLRMESDEAFEMGQTVEIAFPQSVDHVRAYGRVVWSRRLPSSRRTEAGVAIEAWHGVVLGGQSWLRFKGAHPRRDRRANPR
jgi:hypothetical protein